MKRRSWKGESSVPLEMNMWAESWLAYQRGQARNSHFEWGSGLDGMWQNWKLLGTMLNVKFFLFLVSHIYSSWMNLYTLSYDQAKWAQYWGWFLCGQTAPGWGGRCLSLKCSVWPGPRAVLLAPLSHLAKCTFFLLLTSDFSPLWFPSAWKGSDPWLPLIPGCCTCPDYLFVFLVSEFLLCLNLNLYFYLIPNYLKIYYDPEVPELWIRPHSNPVSSSLIHCG